AALLLGLLELLLVHRRVGAAEVRLLLGHLRDAGAGAVRVVVDLAALGLVVGVGPLLHHGSDERRAAALEAHPPFVAAGVVLLIAATADHDGDECRRQGPQQSTLHGTVLHNWSCAAAAAAGNSTPLSSLRWHVMEE